MTPLYQPIHAPCGAPARDTIVTATGCAPAPAPAPPTWCEDCAGGGR